MSDDRTISLFHPFANWVLRAWYPTFLKLDIGGLENVPRTGPLLIVINHTHFLDPLIPTAYLRPDIYPMAKAEVFEGKWKWIFDMYGSFAVRRGEADIQAFKHAFKLLRAGHVVLMAPEGTRAKVGGLQQAHEGAGLIASRLNAPILPVALWGGRVLTSNLKKLRRTTISVRIHEPLVVRSQEKKFSRQEIATITDEIMYSLAAMLPPEYRGVYSNVEAFAPKYLLPYHAFAPNTGANAEVIPLTN
jgi:1-acyl-sn-glycerol-3-phosphate acyltransferase